jgi:PAS domain S-box-containing protein
MNEPEIPAHPPPAASAKTKRDLLFELSLDLLCVAGLDGYFKEVNPSWTRVLGWSREELLSRPIVEFMHPEDRERTLRARQNLARGIPVRDLENRYRCKDGSYRWLSWQSSIEPGAATVIAVARDITAHRQAEKERLILSKIESTGTLAGGIAHDFNNLLASLLLNLEMIGLVGPLTTQQQTHLRQAHDTIQSARALIQQLVVFAQGEVSVRLLTDPRELLRESLELALRGSNIRGETDFAPDLRPIEVDAAQIGQAIRNLVLNARESMPGGGVVRLKADNITQPAGSRLKLPPGDYVRITVSDEGSGISPDALPNIFDPYFSTKPRGHQKGMGLGLTICHSVMQKHGGSIEVSSSPGRGTTVICHLPAARPGPGSAPPPPLSASTARSRKILIMDDEPSLLDIVAQITTRLGYEVATAADGDAAISLFEKALHDGAPFVAALLDLTVRGGKGGAETLHALRGRDPAIRAILMTGYNDAEAVRHHLEHGFAATLAKPFTSESLRATLETVLGVSPAAPAPR